MPVSRDFFGCFVLTGCVKGLCWNVGVVAELGGLVWPADLWNILDYLAELRVVFHNSFRLLTPAQKFTKTTDLKTTQSGLRA